MNKLFFTGGLLIFNLTCLAQNEYQSQLYILTNRLNIFEKKYFLEKDIDYPSPYGEHELDLIKDFHRLGEESEKAGYDKTIDRESSDLISLTTEVACNRLTLLKYYLKYHKDLYKINYDRSKTIFLSLYLKVKALEQ